MIGQGIANFFKNLKYFFNPLGTLALGFLFGLSVFIPGVLSAIAQLAQQIQTILNGTTIDFVVLKDGIVDAVRSLNWDNPLTAVLTMFSEDWLNSTINSCVGAFVDNVENYAAELSIAIDAFGADVLGYASAFLTFIVLGMIGGYLLTKWLVRRNMARRTLWKYMLHSLADSVITATLVALWAWLFTVWQPSIFISTLVSVVLFGFISLLEAYIVHGLTKVDRAKIINGKNILKLIVTDVLIFAIAAVIVVLAILITNAFVGIFIGIVVLEIAFIVIGLNAEAYVKSVADGSNNK